MALLAVTLKWAETRWVSAFFRLHTGPGGLSCAATPPRHRVLADSEHRQKMSRAGSNGLDRGSHVLGIGLNRYRPSTRQYVYMTFPPKIAARLENCPDKDLTSKAKDLSYKLCGYGAFYWQSGTTVATCSICLC